MRKILLSIGMLFAVSASAQQTLGHQEFVDKVLSHNLALKESKAQSKAMQKAMQVAKTAFLPAVDMAGNYQYKTEESSLSFGSFFLPLERDAVSVDLTVAQPIYAGGAIVNSYKAAKIKAEMAEESVELTTDNVIYAAEAGYWGTAAQKEMYRIVQEYVRIIRDLMQVLQNKYEDGYIAKIDLIQMQTRLKEAELQLSATSQAYHIALQNLNVMMGLDAMDELDLKDPVSYSLLMPVLHSAEDVWNVRPDFSIARKDVDYQKKQVSLAASKYNPTISVGFKEGWGTKFINTTGEKDFSGALFVSFKMPIFHWGARFKSVGAQKQLLSVKEFALQEKREKLSGEIANVWTKLAESRKQIQIAEEHTKLAEENLELNTFSYMEGRLTVLDVLSAQLTWIQAYTNLIQSHYQMKIAYSDYKKISGTRYLN